ncbi:hypothetical protein J3B02_006547, partial [Coemansia erecta]
KDDGVYDWNLLNDGYGYAANSAAVSAAARQNQHHGRVSGAYKAENQNHISNQALRSYDNVAHRQSTPNMDNSASNTPGKHSRDHLSPVDAKGPSNLSNALSPNADAQQTGKPNGFGHHSTDAANIRAHDNRNNVNNVNNGHAHGKQGFMFKIKSVFGCCSSSSV